MLSSSNSTIDFFTVAFAATAEAIGFPELCFDNNDVTIKGVGSSAGRSDSFVESKPAKYVALVALIFIVYYCWSKLNTAVREWKRRYLLFADLPTPDPMSMWFYHIKNILAAPSVRKKPKEKNAWTVVHSWCKSMCYEKGHGGFAIHIFSPSRLPFVCRSIFFVIDYDLVQQAVNHPDLQSKGLKYDQSKPLLDNSVLIAPTGHDWKRMRKLTSKAFSNTVMKNVHNASIKILHEKVFPYLDERKKRQLDDSDNNNNNNSDNGDNNNTKYVDVVDLLDRFTLDLLGIASFSYDFGGIDELVSSSGDVTDGGGKIGVKRKQQQKQQQQEKSVHQLFSEITHDIVIAEQCASLYEPPRMKKNVRALDDIIYDVIDKRLSLQRHQSDNVYNNSSNNNNDLLDYLLETNSDDNNGGKTTILTREEILGNTKMFSFAGSDTTSTVMAAMFYELSLHPEVVEKIREEIDPFFFDDKDTCSSSGGGSDSGRGSGPSYNDLRIKCKYVNKVVRETLRLHAPGIFSRTATKDVVLKSSKYKYIVPKDTQIIFSPWLTQRYFCHSLNSNGNSAEVSGEGGGGGGEGKCNFERRSPPSYNTFNPDRTYDYNNNPFFPFALGLRNCVGREMAMAEIRSVLVHVVRNYDLVLRPEDKIDGMELYVLCTLKIGNYDMEFVKRGRRKETKKDQLETR